MEFVNKTKRLYAPSNSDEKGEFAVLSLGCAAVKEK